MASKEAPVQYAAAWWARETRRSRFIALAEMIGGGAAAVGGFLAAGPWGAAPGAAVFFDGVSRMTTSAIEDLPGIGLLGLGYGLLIGTLVLGVSALAVVQGKIEDIKDLHRSKKQ